jgi:acetyl esterase
VEKVRALTGGMLGLALLAGGCRSGEPAPRPYALEPTRWGPRQVTAPTPNAGMKAVLDELASLGGKPIETLSAEDARRQPTPADAVASLLRKQGRSVAPQPVAVVQDIDISTSLGPLPGRVYRPEGAGPFPILVYWHGGGWVLADLDTYDATPRALANGAACVVVSCHYRQAPEHTFPAAHEDAVAAYRWVLQNAASFRGDPGRVAVAGESAGGNLAATVAILARDQGLQRPLHQLLIYPVAGYDFNTRSYHENAAARPLNRDMMKWFFRQYLRHTVDAEDWRISLVQAPSLHRLPPATVITAAVDPLRSEGERYADRLREAGVEVEERTYDGVSHEFFGMAALLPEARDAQEFAAKALRKAFHAPRETR